VRVQQPVERTLIVERWLGEGRSSRGDPFLEAETDQGVAAFWGSADSQENLLILRSVAPPFSVTCGCVRPSPRYVDQHALWVPEHPRVGRPTPFAATTAHLAIPHPQSRSWRNVPLLVDRFSHWLDVFDRSGPFRRSGQLEWHRRTIDRRLSLGSADAAIRDREFLDGLYQTLQAWGIGARSSRLRTFEDFCAELRRHRGAIVALDSLRIDDPDLDVASVRARLWSLVDDLVLVENRAKLVSGTKALHHLLPDLVVPMDRRYTQVFFGWQNPQFQYGQRECLADAFDAFVHIARAVRPATFVGAGWRSSQTKVLDNGLVAVVGELNRVARRGEHA
jgi:hypothetical protein